MDNAQVERDASLSEALRWIARMEFNSQEQADIALRVARLVHRGIVEYQQEINDHD